MTEREQEQAKALKVAVVDANIPDVLEWDRDFIRSIAYKAEQKRWMGLTDSQRSQLRRLLVKYTDEMTKAGKRELTFSERNPPNEK